MSCNGCRILRKGCNENCVLRQSLEGIDNPQAQANATVFVAKFFGRAGLMSFLSSVPESKRPALFQSLLFEACGRTINPVNGAVGLLGTGNWHACQAAVDSVLRGGVPRPLAEFRLDGTGAHKDDLRDSNMRLNKRKLGHDDHNIDHDDTNGLDLGLTAGLPARITARGRIVNGRSEKHRPASPSDESVTTMLESCFVPGDQRDGHGHDDHETKLLRLFF